MLVKILVFLYKGFDSNVTQSVVTNPHNIIPDWVAKASDLLDFDCEQVPLYEKCLSSKGVQYTMHDQLFIQEHKGYQNLSQLFILGSMVPFLISGYSS